MAYVVATTWLSGRQHFAFADLSDIHIFENVLWNTVHGRVLHSGMMGMNSLGDHVSPSLLLLAPVYAVYPRAATLILLQRVLFAASALLLYGAATRVLGSAWAAATLSLAYLVYPPLHGVNLLSFTPVALSVPLVMWVFWCYETRRRKWIWLALVLALGVKENVPFVLAGFALYAAVFRRDWRFGLPAVAASLAWFALSVWVVIPHFRGDSFDNVLTQRFYGPTVGGTVGEVARFLLTHPLAAARIATRAEPLGHLWRLFGPLCLLPLAAPDALLSAAAVLVQNVLARGHTMNTTLGHYHTAAVPGIAYATVHGLDRVARGCQRCFGWPARRTAAVCAAAVLACCAAWLPLSTTGRLLVRSSWEGDLTAPPMPAERRAVARRLMARVPRTAVLACTLNLANHMAGRAVFWRDMRHLERWREIRPDWVLLDMGQGAVEGLQHAAADLEELSALLREDYTCEKREAGFVLLRRDEAGFEFTPEEIHRFWSATWTRARGKHETHPHRPDLLRDAALVLMQMGLPARAATLLENGIPAAEPRAYLYVALGLCRQQMGHRDQAVETSTPFRLSGYRYYHGARLLNADRTAEYRLAGVRDRALIDAHAHPAVSAQTLEGEFPVGTWFDVYDYGVGDTIVWPRAVSATLSVV